MGFLYDALDFAALRRSWLHVSQTSEGEVPSESIARFADGADERLEDMAADLRAGGYLPGRLTQVAIDKAAGGARVLHVPTVRDRVLERAVLHVVTPLVDPWLGPSSFAYRRGLGVQAAVRAVTALRDEGLAWVVRCDVDDCFETIPRAKALRMLQVLVPDPELMALVRRLFSRESVGPRGRRAVPAGLPQGSALSPLLCNLVLAEVDQALLNAGFPVVRFADDIVVAAESQGDGHEALRVLSEILQTMAMRLGSDKTMLTSFAEGFTFVGEDFGPRYPPALDAEVVTARKVVYVSRQGSRVRVRAGRIVVESKDDEELLSVPSGHVGRIVVFGSVGLTAGLRSWASVAGAELVYLSRNGSLQGSMRPADGRARVERLRWQLDAFDDEARALALARLVVEAKLTKQTVLLQRFGRRSEAEKVSATVSSIHQLLRMLPAAETRAEVMGLEGAAARAYFDCLGDLVPEEVRFEGRSRRPARDIANACLSYGYSILLSECLSALAAAGLEPGVCALHAQKGDRPGLALDLMEEFRPYVVDQVTVRLLRRGGITAADGRTVDGGGVHLSKKARSTFLQAYEQRMNTSSTGGLPQFGGTVRHLVYRQAERVARWCSDPGFTWTGISWRA